jgi:hypothetical protein
MRRLVYVMILPLLLAGCYPTTKVTGSWKNPKQNEKQYHSVFIATITKNTIAKSTIEKDMGEALAKHGVAVIKSVDELPPTFGRDSLSRQQIRSIVKQKGCDAILTVSFLKKETESRYVSGPYVPMRWGYYGSFWGYYNYWYPSAYSEAYVTQDAIYYFETNLYDADTEELVWSAQSKTWSYDYLSGFSKEFAALIVDQMKKDGLLKNGIAKN